MQRINTNWSDIVTEKDLKKAKKENKSPRQKDVKQARHGSQNGNAKIAEWQAREIALDFTSSHSELARKYGISRFQVARIRKGKAWKHAR